ncbi:hypothetical protein BJX63DRAFT_435437 [Aspergillus granulosus]|uniref:Uncharacterized protein n=1 Tax=Aspergillus granulosus TaxID=176169 RepID=A0ABR4H151_9EURO
MALLGRSWGPTKRAEALRAGAANGEALRTCRTDPDFFLSRLQHSATHTLHEQYLQGPDGQAGDGQVIRTSMQQGLCASKRYPFELTRMMDDAEYGESFKARDSATYHKMMSALSYAIDAGAIAPRGTAELVMQRQLYILQSFNILMEDVLDLGSTSGDTTAPNKKPHKGANQVQTAPAKPEKLSVPELLLRAQDQKSTADDYLALCRNEPAFLTPIVNMCELMEPESEALADISVTAPFIQALATSLPLPPSNSKKGQAYFPKIMALISDIEELSDDVDLSQYVAPIDNLPEPGIAREALVALDKFIVDKAGVGLGLLYDGLAEEAMSSVQARIAESEQVLEQQLDAKLSLAEPPSTSFIVEQRRKKTKTRPANSSVYSIVPTEEASTETESIEPTPVHKVKQTTFDVFTALFSKGESQAPVTWAAFQSAMADLKFSVVPRFGSIFTFIPPKDFSPPKSFTIHRPHQSRIEGYKLLYFAKRLKRIYRWDEASFTTT